MKKQIDKKQIDKKQDNLKVFTFPSYELSVKAVDYKWALKELKIILANKKN